MLRTPARTLTVVLLVAGIPTSVGNTQADESSAPVEEIGGTQEPAAVAADAAASVLLPPGPHPDQYPNLPRLLRVSPNIYTGGQPVGDEAFDQLSQLGVRIVVSVDGYAPDAAAAKAKGLRYIHIPMGYDGVSPRDGASLTRLVREHNGPFYIHCHHGQHRGPTAAAIACVASGVATSRQARDVLKASGVAKQYIGLWRDVAAFQPPPSDADLPELVETAEVDSLAAVMAQVDRYAAVLNRHLHADGRNASEDLPPTLHHNAVLVRESLRSDCRSGCARADRPSAFAARTTR